MRSQKSRCSDGLRMSASISNTPLADRRQALAIDKDVVDLPSRACELVIASVAGRRWRSRTEPP